MAYSCVEPVLVHFLTGSIYLPVVMPDTVDCGHHSSAVMASMAMHEDWLIRRVVDDFEKCIDLRGGWPGFIAHSDPEELHPGGFDFSLFTTLALGL
jgi:hypothetical protein